MPYSGSSDASLPAAVKRLPRRVREIWVRVFNENYDADDEGKAFRAAWAASRNALKEKQQMSDGKSIKSFAELAAIVLHGEPSEKATKQDAGRQYESSAYLIVPDEAETSGWKVRVEETPGVITRAQLGRAAAALGPSGFRGRTLEATDEEKQSAARKLIMLYREDGADDADIPSYLWDIADMHESDAESEETEDTEEVAETEEKEAHPSFVEFKAFEQADGRNRWIGISSGGFEDRDQEIVSTPFLDSCIAGAEKAGQRGPLRVWHIEGSDIGDCDTQVVYGQPGFLIESGLFDDTDDGRRAAAYYKEHAPEMGMSIKFLFVNRTDGIYMPPGMIIERSVLPRERAAFPWSGLSLEESAKMAKASKEAIAELARVLGEERATAIVSDLEEGAKSLQEAGVRFKAVEAERVEGMAQETTAALAVEPVESETEKAAEPEAVAEAEPEADETAASGPDAEEAPAEVAEEAKAATEATPAPEMALVLDEAALAEIAKQAAGMMTEQLTATITAQIGPLVARLDELHAATKQMSADVETLRQGDDARIAEKVANLPRATVRYMTRPTQAAREEAKSGETGDTESMLEKGKRALYG